MILAFFVCEALDPIEGGYEVRRLGGVVAEDMLAAFGKAAVMWPSGCWQLRRARTVREAFNLVEFRMPVPSRISSL